MLNAEFWQNRYVNNDTAWDIGEPSAPLKEYIDGLEDKNIRILIPGCGNAHEAAYLFKNGFKNIYIADYAEKPLTLFANKHPDFPKNNLLNDDFFNLTGKYDLIIEQTFFCALDPSLREAYCKKMNSLLSENGKLSGVLFDCIFEKQGPPFSGTKDEYLPLFNKYFEIESFEKCKNSIEPRKDRELFIICSKKETLD